MAYNRWAMGRGAFRIVLLVALAAGLCASAAAAQVPQPGQGAARRPAEEPPPQTGPLPVFSFHSGLWINLHHFLYQQARLGRSPEEAAGLPRFSPPTTEERAAWRAALRYYEDEIIHRDLLFTGVMIAIKNRLAELEACPDLSGRENTACTAGLRPELVAALERAAPVYRRHLWAAHDRGNRDWIAAVTPLVLKHGGALAQRLARAYRAPWPAEKIRVDVAVYAGRVGGYTSLDPLHVTVSSTDARNQGSAALELLFHEASHALAREVRDGIARWCRAFNKPIPRDLWHAVLFYTTGEMVRRILADGGEGYVPYAVRHGLYARGWQRYLGILETHWKPYLDGRAEFDAALSRLAAAL